MFIYFSILVFDANHHFYLRIFSKKFREINSSKTVGFTKFCQKGVREFPQFLHNVVTQCEEMKCITTYIICKKSQNVDFTEFLMKNVIQKIFYIHMYIHT